MKTLGIVGWSGSGKTTLLVAMVAALSARGLRVSTMKHAHHDFDVDQPQKDSYRHRQAGAVEVLISSNSRWALMHEHANAADPSLPEPSSADLRSHLSPVDILLIEGFKREPHPKLEVHRPSHGQPLLATGDPTIVAVASDVPVQTVPELTVPRLDLNDHIAITDYVVNRFGLLPSPPPAS